MQQVQAVENKGSLVFHMIPVAANQTVSPFMQVLEKTVLDWAKQKTDLKIARRHSNDTFKIAIACRTQVLLTNRQIDDIEDFVQGLLKEFQSLTVVKVRQDNIYVTLKFLQETPSLS